MKHKALFLLAMLGFMQGTAFLFIKIAVPFLHPFAIVFLRILLALPFLYLYVRHKNYDVLAVIRPYKSQILLLSFTSIIVPFSLIAWAGRLIPSGIASVYMAFIPIFVAVFEILFRNEYRFKKTAYVGLCLGFIGVLMLSWHDITSHGLGNLWGHLLCLLSAVFYAYSVFKTKLLSSMPPPVLSFSILSVATLVLTPVGLYSLTLMPFMLTPRWWAVLGLAMISTAGALILMYYLIDKVGTVFTATTNYLVPIFGMLLGYLFLDESLNSLILPALLCILMGLYLVSTGKIQKHSP